MVNDRDEGGASAFFGNVISFQLKDMGLKVPTLDDFTELGAVVGGTVTGTVGSVTGSSMNAVSIFGSAGNGNGEVSLDDDVAGGFQVTKPRPQASRERPGPAKQAPKGTSMDAVLQQTKLETPLDGPAKAAKLSLYESDDGRFRGTLEDVNAYELKQRQASGKFNVYESDDGLFRGELEDVNAYEERLRQANGTYSVYESNDGRFRGSLEDVNKYESGRVRLDAYMADTGDGFVGTFEQCVEHEAETGLGHFFVYQAPDGFRGSYDEVLAHEKILGLNSIYEVYTASDGFRGTYEQCFRHEQKHGLQHGGNGASCCGASPKSVYFSDV